MFDSDLDSELVTMYATNFYGYGDDEAPLWFVGLEEGGGADVQKVKRRLNAWKERGCHDLEDLKEFHESIDINSWFRNSPKIQTTWGKYIRLLLSARNGAPASDDGVREFQTSGFGQRHSRTCLMELLPLPSPSIGDWNYKATAKLPWLESRRKYRLHHLPARAKQISQKIKDKQPKVVVFAARKFEKPKIWLHFEGFPALERDEVRGISFASLGKTRLIVTQHPAARGVTNEYFEKVGEWLRAEVGSV